MIFFLSIIATFVVAHCIIKCKILLFYCYILLHMNVEKMDPHASAFCSRCPKVKIKIAQNFSLHCFTGQSDQNHLFYISYSWKVVGIIWKILVVTDYQYFSPVHSEYQHINDAFALQTNSSHKQLIVGYCMRDPAQQWQHDFFALSSQSAKIEEEAGLQCNEWPQKWHVRHIYGCSTYMYNNGWSIRKCSVKRCSSYCTYNSYIKLFSITQVRQ